MAHDHFARLDYVGGTAPYECVDDGLRFTGADVRDHNEQRMRAHDAAAAAAGTPPSPSLVAWENDHEDQAGTTDTDRRTTREGSWSAAWIQGPADDVDEL